ncbi:acyl-CoA dehydrogenase family protein [Prauserella oleivorans]|uniref:Acyl-CoA dehydrogenase family protein n=1 Tax=Prauserella oleivorans TaxID=1478153 RepID=A0ABW5W7G8_9PSEU
MSFYEPEHEFWRQTVRTFVRREVEPNVAAWERAGRIDPELWRKAAAQGLLGLSLPEEYGGGGEPDYRYRFIVMEELARVGAASVNAAFSLVDDLVGPYLLDLATDEQKKRLIPGLCDGTLTTAIAMTEPGAGSDLRGVRTLARQEGGDWVLNGSKTFITNGEHADFVVVLARSGEDDGKPRFSLFIVERGMPGFSSGTAMETIGRRGEAVSELFFDDVRVPGENVLGTVGRGFPHVMERLPKERMSIACYSLAIAEAAVNWTVGYTRERSAFGTPIAQFQHTKFGLAEMATEVDVTRAFIERSVLALNAGTLSPVEAAKAKWWASELAQRVIARCLQMHGGYGYTLEFPIARAFLDSRVQTIYGGTTEIMKEVIGRSLLA